LREELVGKQVTQPQAFEVNPDFIEVGGEVVVNAWVKVLRSILPTIVQGLPAEEYQVVRRPNTLTRFPAH
jgi:hypothetical protein